LIAAFLVLAAVAALAAWPRARVAPHAERVLPPPIAFQDENGKAVDLGAFRGQVVLLDFWATWCLPCREEMPSFDRLEARLGGRGLKVVPVSVDLKGMEAVEAFYREFDIRHLPKYVDDSRESAQSLGLRGIPATIALDRRGREAFRVEGPLDWDGPGLSTRLETLLAE
jgi:thiol-disulfide isomerase/thioredoxin